MQYANPCSRLLCNTRPFRWLLCHRGIPTFAFLMCTSIRIATNCNRRRHYLLSSMHLRQPPSLCTTLSLRLHPQCMHIHSCIHVRRFAPRRRFFHKFCISYPMYRRRYYPSTCNTRRFRESQSFLCIACTPFLRHRRYNRHNTSFCEIDRPDNSRQYMGPDRISTSLLRIANFPCREAMSRDTLSTRRDRMPTTLRRRRSFRRFRSFPF